MENMRESLDNMKLQPLKLPDPPRMAAEWLSQRKQAAVRFVAGVRQPQKASRT